MSKRDYYEILEVGKDSIIFIQLIIEGNVNSGILLQFVVAVIKPWAGIPYDKVCFEFREYNPADLGFEFMFRPAKKLGISREIFRFHPCVRDRPVYYL